jgi:hypothetical protein
MAVFADPEIGSQQLHYKGVGTFWLCDVDLVPTGNRKNTSNAFI